MIEETLDTFRSALVKNRIPLEICYEVTTKCNFHCVHCFNRENYYDELSFEKLDYLEQFIRESETLTLILTGGEFFIHPYAMEILDRMKRIKNMEIIVYSNASLINDDIARFLKSYNIKLEVTIYGTSCKTYKTVTGDADNYYKVLEGLTNLNHHRVNYKLKSIILRQNFDEVEEIRNILFEHNGEHTFINFELFGSNKRICESRLTDKQSLQLYKQFGIQRFTKKIPFGACGAGRLQCCIRPDGSVIPCVGWNEMIIGNIETDSFKKISSSFDMTKLRELDIKCRTCERSDYCDVCPMFFYQNTGSSSIISPELCRSALLRQKACYE